MHGMVILGGHASMKPVNSSFSGNPCLITKLYSLKYKVSLVWCMWVAHEYKVSLVWCMWVAREYKVSLVWCMWMAHEYKVSLVWCMWVAHEYKVLFVWCMWVARKYKVSLVWCMWVAHEYKVSLVWCMWVARKYKVSLVWCMWVSHEFHAIFSHKLKSNWPPCPQDIFVLYNAPPPPSQIFYVLMLYIVKDQPKLTPHPPFFSEKYICIWTSSGWCPRHSSLYNINYLNIFQTKHVCASFQSSLT